MSEINTQKLEYTGASVPVNTTKVSEAAFSGAFGGASSRAPAVVVVDANLDDAVGTSGTAAVPPVGGSGMLGWLSGIYARLGDVLNIRALSSATDSVSVGNFPSVQQAQVTNFPATQSVSGTLSVDNFPSTQVVSAIALPLPAGAASETTLSAVNTKLPATLGQKTSAASLPVVIASDQTVIPANLAQLAGVALDASGLAVRSPSDLEAAGRIFIAAFGGLNAGSVLHAATAGYLGTAPAILIVAGAKPVTLREVRLKCTVAGAGGTSYQLIAVADSIPRYTSGGTALSARNNAFATSAAVVRIANTPIVAAVPSATARFVVQSQILKAGAPVVNEQFRIVFDADMPYLAGVYYNPAFPNITIPAGGSLALHFVSVAAWTAVPQFEGNIIIQE